MALCMLPINSCTIKEELLQPDPVVAGLPTPWVCRPAMRSSVHVPAAVEALLGHPVAALSERPAPRLTRLLVNVTVERSLWPVHVLLGADATVADLARAAYAVEGRRR